MSADLNYYLFEEEQEMQQALPQTSRKKKQLSKEDMFILTNLEKLKEDLKTIHRNLDDVTDQDLIDSFIFEMNALNMRYKFYLQICKEKGLISSLF